LDQSNKSLFLLPVPVKARYLNSRKFEELVINKIKERILTEGNLQELVCLVNEEMDSAAGNYQEDLNVVSDEIAGANSRLERLYDVLLTYTMPLPPEGISEERVGVLYSIPLSGAEVSIGRTFEVAFSLAIC